MGGGGGGQFQFHVDVDLSLVVGLLGMMGDSVGPIELFTLQSHLLLLLLLPPPLLPASTAE